MIDKFAVCIAAMLWCVNVTAQTQSENDAPQVLVEKPNLVITVDIDGNAVLTKVNALSVGELSRSAELLRFASVRNELELTSEQFKKITALLKQTDQQRENFRRQIARLNNAETREKIQAEFARLVKEFSEKEQKILLSHQQRLLNQIANRIRCRREGPLPYFSQLERDNKNFKLTANEQRRIKALGKKMSPEIAKQVETLISESHDELIDSLNENQKKIVSEYFKPAKTQTKNFDLFLAQLSEKNSQEWSLKYNAIFNRLVVYFVQADGTLVQQAQTQRMQQSTDAELLLPYMEWAESLRSGTWGKQLKISNEQKATLTQILTELEKVEKNLASMIANSENPALAIESSNDMQIYHRKNTRKQILGLLTTTQKLQLNGLYSKTAFKRFGLFSELTCGELGRTIKLTSDQKNKIKSAANKIAKKLRQEASAIEAKYFEELLQCLDGQNRQIVRRRIGKDLKHISANVTEILRGFSQ